MLLVGGTTIFIGNLGSTVDETQGQLAQMEDIAQESKEDYINLSIRTQQIFLQTVEESWEVNIRSNPNLSEDAMLSRFRRSMNVLLNQAWDSMIVAIRQEGEIVYQGYIRDEYTEYFEKIVWEEIPIRDLYTIDDAIVLDEEEGERLFISGTTLRHEELELEVYVFFEEDIMLDTMVESFSIELLNNTRSSLSSILSFVAFFMVFVIGLSLLIMFFLRKIYIDTKSTCPYYGNSLCYATKVMEAKKKSQKGTGGY